MRPFLAVRAASAGPEYAGGFGRNGVTGRSRTCLAAHLGAEDRRQIGHGLFPFADDRAAREVGRRLRRRERCHAGPCLDSKCFSLGRQWRKSWPGRSLRETGDAGGSKRRARNVNAPCSNSEPVAELCSQRDLFKDEVWLKAEVLGISEGVSVIERAEVEFVERGRGPTGTRKVADGMDAARVRHVPAACRFRHPGYELLRSISREELSVGGVLDEESGLLLVAAGIKAVAKRKGCCERTVRRQLMAVGVVGRDRIRRVRLRMSETALGNQVPLSILAKWLGFASPDAYRRFIRREFGVSVKGLRRRVRERLVCSANEP